MATIIDGGGVVTVDSQRTVHRQAAIAIEGDRIAAIGPSDEVRRAYPDAEVIDARGKVAFPGFVNLHTHTILTILRGLAEDQGGHSLYGQMYPMKSILTRDDRYTLGLLGCVEALRSGTTCIVENYEGATDVAPAIQQLGVRGVLSENVNDAVMVEIRRGRYEFSEEQGQRQLQAGVDLVEQWHGAENGRITCQLAAHAPDTCSRGLLETIVRLSEELNVGRHVHLAQTPQEVAQVEAREGMRSVEYLASTGYLGPRTIAAHCHFIRPNEVELIGRSGTNVAHCAFISAKRGKIAPIMALQAAGANIGLGSDNMSEDMVEVVRLALIVNRVREAHGSLPSSHDVLEWLTIGGARAVGLDHEIGSLEVGKKADIVLVDYRKAHMAPVFDPVANFVHVGLSSDVDTVFVDGRLLLRDGVVLTADEQEVIEAGQRQAEGFWRRFSQQFGGTVMVGRL
jgi:5-methylthioadenosine/S-adenosylhomocysteine deaminase